MKSKRENLEPILIVGDEKFDESLAPPLPSFTTKDDPEFAISIDVIDVEPKVNKRPKRWAICLFICSFVNHLSIHLNTFDFLMFS